MDKKKILVVDDEQDLLDFVTLRLEANNYQVVVARDGEEALKFFVQEKPDLVLLDIVMPKLNGFKVCQALKKNPAGAKIPIIMLTAKDRVNDIKLAKESGADAYIVKPFDASTLLVTIKDQLHKVKRS